MTSTPVGHLHDAAMTRFRQWWTRNVRAGHAFAEVSWLHRRSPLRIWARETRSNWFWGLLLPLAALVPAYWTWGLSALLLLGYPVLAWKIYRGRTRCGDTGTDAARYGRFCVLGKFAQMVGQLHYHRAAARGLPVKILAAVTKSSSYFMVARPEIDTVKALRGKKIGINSFGSSADYAAYAAVSRSGMIPTKI